MTEQYYRRLHAAPDDTEPFDEPEPLPEQTPRLSRGIRWSDILADIERDRRLVEADWRGEAAA